MLQISGLGATLRKQVSHPSRHPSVSLPDPLQRAMSLANVFVDIFVIIE